MKPVNLRRHNLNSLPVLRDILRHGNLTRASAALGLTQPALSNILKQLRADFDDPLIVRDGKVMRLTPKATALLGPLEAALSTVETFLANKSFDPERATNTFSIATPDHIMTALGPAFTKLAITEAPLVKIRMQFAQESSVQALMVGEIDMLISPKILLSAGLADVKSSQSINTQLLLSEPLVCLAHRDDIEFAAGLTLEAYLARPHAGYALGGRLNVGIEQAYLMRLGLKQNDAMLASCYAALPGIVVASGCLAVVPETLARSAVSMLPLQYAPLPFPTEPIDWTMIWHLRNDEDPATLWLRNSLLRSAVELSTHLGQTS
jgi:LysR family transcriptional regulator, nod-box dependent transcriptional activator